MGDENEKTFWEKVKNVLVIVGSAILAIFGVKWLLSRGSSRDLESAKDAAERADGAVKSAGQSVESAQATIDRATESVATVTEQLADVSRELDKSSSVAEDLTRGLDECQDTVTDLRDRNRRIEELLDSVDGKNS